MSTGTKPRTATNQHVHRDLHLVSPLMQGPDVRELQENLNHLTNHYEFDWHRIIVDGDAGPRTFRQAKFVAELIGLDESRINAIKNGHRVTQEVQRLLRNPETRSKQDRIREERRRPRFQKLRRDHGEGMQAAVEWMVAQVGTNEQPAGTNRGPFPIDECQDYFGLGEPVPWCGCLAGYAIEKIGGIDTGTWWPFSGSITSDARAGLNGLEDVNPTTAGVGCIATFFSGGNDHVGLVRAPARASTLLTVEGNTSSVRGLDSDGGIIELRERSFSELTIVARLTVN